MVDLLNHLYGQEKGTWLLDEINQLLATEEVPLQPQKHDKRHRLMMVAYPDNVIEEGTAALVTLKQVTDTYFKGLFSMVHMLPFFPATGDGGFEISDYWQVRDELGDWEGINRFENPVIDLVLNHVSSKHPWFIQYLAGEEEYEDFAIACDHTVDLSKVPKSLGHELLTPYQMENGQTVKIWTKYGPTQIDLNYRNPKVLLAVLKVLVFYLKKGIRHFRLDALAFVWKDPATDCSNLPEAAMILQIIRAFIDQLCPQAKLIPEVDVLKQRERYIQNGRKMGHLGYNYDFCPIVLHACITGEGQYLKNHLATVASQELGPFLINFLSTHDGVFLKPYDSPLPKEAVQTLCDYAQQRGGRTFYQQLPDGTQRAYEINIAVFALLCNNTPAGYQRLLMAIFLLLSMPGIPAIYLNLLLGAANHDHDGPEGRRTVNRKKFTLEGLANGNFSSLPHQAFLENFTAMVQLWHSEKAFSPYAPTQLIDSPSHVFFVSRKRTQPLYAIANLSDKPATVPLKGVYIDLLTKKTFENQINLGPQGYVWLKIA